MNSNFKFSLMNTGKKIKSLHEFLTTAKEKAITYKPKKRLGWSYEQLAFVLVIMGIIISFTVMRYSDGVQAANMTKMKADIKTIATAASTYQYWSITNELPESIDDMLTGLSASESNDGQDHEGFLRPNNTESGKLLDPWGNEYEYDPAARTISCTPKNLLGNDLEKYTYEF